MAKQATAQDETTSASRLKPAAVAPDKESDIRLELAALPRRNVLGYENIPYAGLVLKAMIHEKDLFQKDVAEVCKMAPSELSRHLSCVYKMNFYEVERVARAIGEDPVKVVKLSFDLYLEDLDGQIKRGT